MFHRLINNVQEMKKCPELAHLPYHMMFIFDRTR